VGDTFVLVMDAPKRNHRILQKGDVLLDADGDPAIALTHVLTTGDDATGLDVRNVGQLTFDGTDTAYFEENSGRIHVSVTLAHPDGTASQPSITFASGTGDGIYRPAAQTLGFSCDGAVRGYIRINGFCAIDGAAVGPSITFYDDLDTGLFRQGNDTLGFSAGAGMRAYMNTGGFKLVDGTAGNPSYSFIADNNTGIYRVDSDNMGFVAGGVVGFGLQSTFIYTNVPITAVSGTNTVPAYSFSASTDMGMYRVGALALGFATNGTHRVSIGTQVSSTVPFRAPDGTVGAPTYSFSDSIDTGMYSPGTDQIGLSTNGVLRLSVSTTAIDITVPITQTGTFVVDATAAVQLKVGATTLLSCNSAVVAITNVPLRLQAGAVGTPSLYFDPDTNTGLYRVGSNNIGITASGSQIVGISALKFELFNTSLHAPVSTIATPPTHACSSSESTLLVNAGTGAYQVNLQAAASHTNRIMMIKKVDASANAVTINANSGAGENIDGAATYALSNQYDGVIIQCDGSDWHILATV
jgi:hypothetical protein